MQPVPVFLHHIDFDLKRDHNSEDFNADDVPSLQHWMIPMSRLFSIQAICANPSNFEVFGDPSLFAHPSFLSRSVPSALLL
jgi:hypothetical protein